MNTEPRSPRYVANQDGAAILDVEHGTITTLNPTGGFIWERLSRGESPDDIIDQLAQEIRMAPSEIADDVREFIEVLHQRKLMPL
jgi:hypothetical protein